MREVEVRKVSVNEFKNLVTYVILPDNRYVNLDINLVRQHGLEKLLQEFLDVSISNKRLPVVYDNRVVGTLPASFDLQFAKSKSFLYDFRPGDFMLKDNTWIASNSLGPGDLDCVAEFQRNA
jgi:hypothetical protein